MAIRKDFCERAFLLPLLVIWNFFQHHYSLRWQNKAIVIRKLLSKETPHKPAYFERTPFTLQSISCAFGELMTVSECGGGLDVLQRRHQSMCNASLKGGVTGRINNL